MHNSAIVTQSIPNKKLFFFLLASFVGALLVSTIFIHAPARAIENATYNWESASKIRLDYTRNCGLISCPGGGNESATLSGSYPTYTAQGVVGDAGNNPDAAVAGCMYTVTVTMTTDSGKGSVSSKSTGDLGCDGSPFNGPITVGQTTNAPTDTSAGASGTAEGEKSSCGIEGMGWIVCPVLGFMGKITDQLFNFLASAFLAVDVNTYSTKSDTYKVWDAMRNIANVAFVIAFVVIIFSQVTSVGINNYGIKKMLPRLVVAAILVNVSYLICQIAVDLSNIVGYAAKGLFDSVGQLTKTNSTVDATGNGFGIAAMVTLIIAGGVTLILAATVPVLLAVLVSLLIIVFILLARKALIVLLIVLAPLAFVAYLLPNTEQWYKKWQKMFFALLLVFPIIAVVFGASNLAAHIIKNTAAQGDDLTPLLAIGVAAIPLVLVPGILKGSITAAGAIGTTMKGLADRNTKKIGSEVSSTSKLGQLNKYRKTEGERRRALMNAGVYEGSKRNPLNWGRNASSRLNHAFNKSPISGGFGDRMTASGQQIAKKLDYEKIDDLKNQLNSESVAAQASGTASDVFLAKQFSSAIEAGDSVRARAAYSALMDQGQGGVDAAQKVLAQAEAAQNFNSASGQATKKDIQEHILNKHADVKGTDARVMGWASSGDMSTDGSHIESLNDGQVATQTYQSLKQAIDNGKLSPQAAARILSNPNAANNMKMKQRGLLEGLAGRGPGASNQPQPTPGGINQQNYGPTGPGGLYVPHGLNQPPSGTNPPGTNRNNTP